MTVSNARRSSHTPHRSAAGPSRPRELRTMRPPRQALGALAAGALAVGGFALGAMAVGAAAVGALAIGRLAVGRLAVGQARIGRLEIDELSVRRLLVAERLDVPPSAASGPGAQPASEPTGGEVKPL